MKHEHLLTKDQPFFIDVLPALNFLKIETIEVESLHGVSGTKCVRFDILNEKNTIEKQETISPKEHLLEALADTINTLHREADSKGTFRLTVTNKTILKITYTTQNHFIPFSKPFADFDEHLTNPINKNILFSAPFGSGKSSFLEHYFDESFDHYNVFSVFPVNYSVASNKDIFKYIKTDILFQLLGKDVEFESFQPHSEDVLATMLRLNQAEITKELISLAGQLGLESSILLTPIMNLKSLFEATRGGLEKDEHAEVISYIRSVYHEEGSLFEDDTYTQLIRALLEQLKEKDDKENILLIEDLDRIDPEHIFRILNVISAHCDAYRINGHFESDNKFGFDRIIIVCDINNIKSIFHHKFGKDTHFEGYINKYFSTAPFTFSNHDAAAIRADIVYNLYEKSPHLKVHRRINQFFDALQLVIGHLVKSNLLSLREMLMIAKFDWALHVQKILKNMKENKKHRQALFLVLIDAIKQVFDLESFFYKIDQLKKGSLVDGDEDFDYLCYYGLSAIGDGELRNTQTLRISNITLTYVSQNRDGYFYQSLFVDGSNKVNFTLSHFYELLKKNFEYYQRQRLDLTS